MRTVRVRTRRVGGMTQEQCAEYLGVTVAEVNRREREAIRKLLFGVFDELKLRGKKEAADALGVGVDEGLFVQGDDDGGAGVADVQ